MFDYHSFLNDFLKCLFITAIHAKNFKFQILNLKKFMTKKILAEFD